MKKNNVTETRKLDMCIGCEICVASCPLSAITMEFEQGLFLPLVDMVTCISCGLCLSLCPGINLDTKNSGSYKELVGPYTEAYTAHTKDDGVRKKSASGGMVTTLVTELLKTGEFDAAFLLTYDSFTGEPARLEACSDEQKVVIAAKSKYVPASAYNVIKILEKDHKKKLIIVGTACLFQGIKQFLKNKNVPEDNLLFIGLFCDKTLNYNIYDYFEKNYGKGKEKLIKFDFRNKDPNGWPGDSKLFFDSGRTQIVSRNVRGQLKDYFQLTRCLFCLNKLNTSADISIGDCYIKREADNQGKSSVIIRTEKGKDIFEKYSYLFVKKKEKISTIVGSQKIDEKRENIANIKIFDIQKSSNDEKQGKINRYSIKELTKKKFHICRGKKRQYFLIKLHRLIKNVARIIIPITIFINVFIRKQQEKNAKQNIVITGGNLQNKGAQAMVFTVASYAKKMFPNKKIYVFSSRKEEDRETYNFDVLCYDLEKKIKVFSKPNPYYPTHEIIEILSNTDFVINISGYALSSQIELPTNLNYLFSIIINRHFSLPSYYLPQSIGPFNYNIHEKVLLFPLIKLFLSYPKKIFIREKTSLKNIYRFTKKNVRYGMDIVLQSNYSSSDIYKKKITPKTYSIKNSVGIIPNKNVIKRTYECHFYQIYQSIIERLLQKGKTVYLLPHANMDFSICKNIKKQFKNEDRVIFLREKLKIIELINIIKQLDFVVASRYHSIVHSYKNGIPAVIIGWAGKYVELAKKFNQLNYLIDIQKLNETKDVLAPVEKMMKKYPLEKEKIITILEQVQSENIFKNLFDET